ncbi:hypothetical protein BFP72_18240 [Reichenbachiella sp. 5M10]|uniref:aspartyl protease family protein n=1 Tax=Reichenbachiella sp. 5M10 TaxID=1889772 RepID=UPI000C15ABAF|nr:aspartyl protease family protein [Reichenbachiella sp. 5M10]PIB37208.1 hypothetical protein BFP72_18240 [Reichenbachiella sp. 5M10]
MKKKLIILSLMLLLVLIARVPLHAQQMGFDLPEGTKKIRINFEVHNNLIVLPITINHFIHTKFILDTGVQYPIITEKTLADLLGLNYMRRIIVQGPGEQDSISALVATDVSLLLPNGVHSGDNQALLVLEEDYLNLRETMGVEIYGIIGYDLFSRFIIEINYDENYLVLHEPKRFKARKRYKKMDMTVYNTKPYVNIKVENKQGETSRLNLMIDTGASHSLLIDNPDDRSILPSTSVSSVIGRGIGGDIEGHLGRVSNVKVGKYDFDNAIVSFPIAGDYGASIKRGSRQGTMGSEFLSRFNVIFDYFSGTLYLKKSKHYAREFEYDMSGMTLMAHGTSFNKFRVNAVRHNSPAYHAGVKVGDIIESINGFDFQDLMLSGATTMLRHKEGKKITLRIIRGEEDFKTSFKLERYI